MAGENIMSAVQRFLGGSPLGVMLRLLVVSFLVGMVLTWLDLRPIDVWFWVEDMAVGLWQQGFAFFGRAGEYVAVGAAVVLPVFILMRVLKWRGPREQ